MNYRRGKRRVCRTVWSASWIARCSSPIERFNACNKDDSFSAIAFLLCPTNMQSEREFFLARSSWFSFIADIQQSNGVSQSYTQSIPSRRPSTHVLLDATAAVQSKARGRSALSSVSIIRFGSNERERLQGSQSILGEGNSTGENSTETSEQLAEDCRFRSKSRLGHVRRRCIDDVLARAKPKDPK